MGPTAPTAIPLSWNQRHRLGQTQLDAQAGSYHPHHSVVALRLRGPLDRAALTAAWNHLQLRHPALRSTVDAGAGVWHHAANEPAPVTWLPPCAGPWDTVVAAARQQVIEPFDLASGPLARLLVLPAGTENHLLAVVVEHLVCDGWSRSILLRDLGGLYSEEAGGEPVPLPDPGTDMAEFTVAQHDYLESPAGLAARRRVAARLAEAGAVPNTPIKGFSGLAQVSHDRTKLISRSVDGALAELLRPAAKASGISRLNLVLAALHCALAELSGCSSVGTSLVVANRERPATQNTVGWFASKLIVQSQPDAFRAVPDYLAAFKADLIDAVSHSRVPWPTTLHDIDPAALGTTASTPFVSFNALPQSMTRRFTPPSFHGLDVTAVPMSVSRNDASIATYWREDDTGLHVNIKYKPDWYGSADVELFWDTATGHLSRIASAAR